MLIILSHRTENPLTPTKIYIFSPVGLNTPKLNDSAVVTDVHRRLHRTDALIFAFSLTCFEVKDSGLLTPSLSKQHLKDNMTEEIKNSIHTYFGINMFNLTSAAVLLVRLFY